MSATKKKRSSWSLHPELYDMIHRDAQRIGIGVNAALNLALSELQEWRSGKRRFVEGKMPAAKVASVG